MRTDWGVRDRTRRSRPWLLSALALLGASGVARGQPLPAAAPAGGQTASAPAGEGGRPPRVVEFAALWAEARRKSPSLPAAAAAIERAEAAARLARAGWMPSLRGQVSATHLDDERALGDRVLVPQDAANAALVLTVPLLDVATWRQSGRARTAVLGARERAADVERRLALLLGAGYLRVLLERRALEAADRAVETSRNQLEIAQPPPRWRGRHPAGRGAGRARAARQPGPHVAGAGRPGRRPGGAGRDRRGGRAHRRRPASRPARAARPGDRAGRREGPPRSGGAGPGRGPGRAGGGGRVARLPAHAGPDRPAVRADPGHAHPARPRLASAARPGGPPVRRRGPQRQPARAARPADRGAGRARRGVAGGGRHPAGHRHRASPPRAGPAGHRGLRPPGRRVADPGPHRASAKAPAPSSISSRPNAAARDGATAVAVATHDRDRTRLLFLLASGRLPLPAPSP